MQRQRGQRLAHAGAGGGQRDAEQPGGVLVVHAVVVGAVEVAAQQAVARIALVLHDADDAAHRHAHQRQRMAGQHQRALDRFRHHLGGAGGLQLLEVAVVDGANDHRHLGRVLLHQAQDASRAEAVSW